MPSLRRFAEAFASEEDLRAAFVTLLTKMPGISEPHQTHGAHEHGKDIVFYSEGGLGDRRLNACVVKSKKIVGSVDSNRGARTILIQAEQALDSPYIGSSGEDQCISHVYVVSPWECSQQTRASIQGKLHHRSGQVTFYCGQQLLTLFEKCWPEFLLFESNLLGAYVRSAHQTLDSETAVDNVLFRSGFLVESSKSLKNLYIQPSFHQLYERYDFNIDIPDAETIVRTRLRSESAAIQLKLRRLAAIITAPQLWTPAGIRNNKPFQLAADILALADNIGSTVQRSSKFTTDALASGGHDGAAAAKLAAMSERHALKSRARPLIKQLSRLADDMRRRVDAANRCQIGSLSILRRKDYLTYCSVQDAAATLGGVLVSVGTTATMAFPENLLDTHHGSLFISGAAGYGKTTFCRANTIKDLGVLARDGSPLIPVYVPLHQLTNSKLESFEESFIRSPELRDFLIQKTSASGRPRLRLYLDGLDEVPTVGRQQQIVELVERGMARYSSLQVVITARNNVGGPWLNWLPPCAFISIL